MTKDTIFLAAAQLAAASYARSQEYPSGELLREEFIKAIKMVEEESEEFGLPRLFRTSWFGLSPKRR